MGKKINFRASDNLYMFQVFKCYVHQTEQNEFYVNGTHVEENPGVIVDFQNIEHTYEILSFLGNYWGGWNDAPTSDEMYNISKHWEEGYGAEIIDIGGDSIVFKLARQLCDEEIDVLINEIREINAEPNYSGGFEKLRQIIKEKNEFSICWD